MTALKCTFIVQSAKKTHTSEDNRDTKMVCCDTICTNYFITFNMKEKIEKFLTVNASNIKCTRSNDNIIRDIFDGEVYKELSKTGFDPEKDLTFNFSLDGAPLSKSSTLQAWPIFITINEIDLKFRFKNIFTAGFWISSSQMTNDLNIKNLLTVFVNKMKILQNTGVTYKSDNITKISRIFPLYCVADAPAKAKILNFTNHSGYSSCNYCEIHGIYESNAVRFPYGNNVQLRTKKEWQKCARIAMNTNKAVKGIKGSTPLTDLQGFNIIWGAPPDYMHIILLGVMKTLFELYFTNTGNPWYIGSPKQQGEALAIQSLNISNKIILYGNIKFSHFTVDTKNNNTVFLVDGKVGRVTKIFKNSESLYLLFQEYKVLSMGNALPQAKTIDLLQTMKKNLTQTSKISSDSEYSSDGDGEVYLPKRKVDEYENKIINQKKKIKTLQNAVEVLKSKNASLETDYDTLKKKLNRDGSNAGIEESSCKEMLKILLQQTTEIKASLKTTLEEPSSRNKNKEKEIIFGSISFPEKPFLTISRRPKHSLFVKDLVSLLWSEEDLSQRSLTGKKHYNSKEIKQPLTPEKRFAIEEAFKDRLKKQQYHDVTIAAELKLVNRYIAEKINDVRKCKSRRNLNMIYDIENNNIPREEEKDLSENEPTSNDMIN
ncbi:hypothetical protein Avbf_06539 [Armadillidium vulgare]|nr:hypothetical protein Avbf_06539 [Armadillidium vulgare]